MKRKTHERTSTPAQYKAARDAAQTLADRDGFDRGLEWNAVIGEWHTFILPQRDNRCGFELRCEVVSCSDLARCRPGHGPGPLACGWIGG